MPATVSRTPPAVGTRLAAPLRADRPAGSSATPRSATAASSTRRPSSVTGADPEPTACASAVRSGGRCASAVARIDSAHAAEKNTAAIAARKIRGRRAANAAAAADQRQRPSAPSAGATDDTLEPCAERRRPAGPTRPAPRQGQAHGGPEQTGCRAGGTRVRIRNPEARSRNSEDRRQDGMSRRHADRLAACAVSARRAGRYVADPAW